MNNNITLIIYGELEPLIINMVQNNIDKYKIILVTNSNKNNILDELYKIESLLIIKYKKDNIYSSYLGLCNVTTEYSIIFRGDEYFENIDPLVDYMINNDKVVVSNFEFTKTYFHKYNISTHFIGYKTDVLFRAFKVLVSNIENNYIEEYKELSLNRVNSPEQRIAIAILRSMNIPIVSFNNIKVGTLINKYFHIFDSNKFGNFIYNKNKLSDEFNYVSSNNDINRLCDIDNYDYDVVFLFGNNSILNPRYKNVLNIIKSFGNKKIIIYSNDNMNNSNIINTFYYKNNIKIVYYKEYDTNKSSNILFVINNDGINLIFNKVTKTNNLYLLLDELLNMSELECLELLSGYIDYQVFFNNINLNELPDFIKNKTIDLNEIHKYINVKNDDIDLNEI